MSLIRIYVQSVESRKDKIGSVAHIGVLKLLTGGVYTYNVISSLTCLQVNELPAVALSEQKIEIK